jgi:hypothetical protein
VAVNSGLVSYPTGYTPAYRTAGLTLWAPTPPEGYVALGFLARPGDEPPSLTEVRAGALQRLPSCPCPQLPLPLQLWLVLCF